jgi:endo-1,4-beta-xylanase
MRYSRRTYLRSMGLVTAASLAVAKQLPRASAEEIKSLRAVAASNGLHFGAAAENDLPGPRRFRGLFVQQCELFSAILPWAVTEPVRGSIDTSRADPTLDFALGHGLKLTGCHLLWHEAFPGWFQHIGRGEEMQQAVVDHSTRLVSRFRGKTFSWNVLNEAIEPQDGRSDGLRVHGLLDKVDLTTISLSFHAARNADPNALLVYNDYGFEADTPAQEARRRALLKLLDTFARSDLPIDAVGLQSHLSLSERETFNAAKYRHFLSQIAARGLKIIISELDVLNPEESRSIAETDRAVADLYARFLHTALDERAVIAVVVWGLSDRYSWLKQRSRFLQRPLPFDDDFEPTPAFYAILDALQSAPHRQMRESRG